MNFELIQDPVSDRYGKNPFNLRNQMCSSLGSTPAPLQAAGSISPGIVLEKNEIAI